MAGTIGDELRRYFREGMMQKEFAIAWLEAWKKNHPGDDSWSIDTAESRLSSCLRGRVDGVKFFLGDRKRRDTTFEVLGAPAAARDRLTGLAEMLLAERPIRLVVDATRGPQEGARAESMFKAIREYVLGEAAVFPTLLIVTEAQHERLPFSFHEFIKVGLTVEPARDTHSARARVDELAARGALIVAPYPIPDISRWIAIRFDEPIALDPPNGLLIARQGGMLPGLPEVN
ncbi:hypothetical protein WME76_48400, partial (plasmid) [Sorangium sp. So ce119]